MADIATTLIVFGGFLLVFCAAGALTEWVSDRRRSRRLRQRISRYGA